MEGHSSEAIPDIGFREVSLSDEETLRRIATLITEHSWFEGYPVDPYDEIKESEYIAGAYAGKALAGFAAVNRVASPDGQNNGELWFADVVVLPEYRKQGIYTKLYDACMEYMAAQPGRILSCTENPVIDEFFLAHGWHKLRDTRDEQGNECRVYEYDRKA